MTKDFCSKDFTTLFCPKESFHYHFFKYYCAFAALQVADASDQFRAFVQLSSNWDMYVCICVCMYVCKAQGVYSRIV